MILYTPRHKPSLCTLVHLISDLREDVAVAKSQRDTLIQKVNDLEESHSTLSDADRDLLKGIASLNETTNSNKKECNDALLGVKQDIVANIELNKNRSDTKLLEANQWTKDTFHKIGKAQSKFNSGHVCLIIH